MIPPYPLHAGEYPNEKSARDYADKLVEMGDIVEVKPVAKFAVMVIGRSRD